MISIVTAVRNQLQMNRLFVEYLKKYTKNTYELIIIDNGSTDGSREFFKKEGAIVIENEGNYSYPHCQNQGYAVAQYDYIAFLNNDLVVSQDWDERIIKAMTLNDLGIVSPSTTDDLETGAASKRLQRKWKYVKYPIRFLFGQTRFSLKLMFALLFPNWDQYVQNLFKKYGFKAIERFSGSAVIVRRKDFELLGGNWDPRIQGADFDMYLRTRDRYIKHGDVKPMHVVLGVFMHHYSRLTAKQVKYAPFVDAANLISVEEKWGTALPKEYLGHIVK